MPGLFDDLYKDYLKDHPFGGNSVFGEKFRAKSRLENEHRDITRRKGNDLNRDNLQIHGESENTEFATLVRLQLEKYKSNSNIANILFTELSASPSLFLIKEGSKSRFQPIEKRSTGEMGGGIIYLNIKNPLKIPVQKEFSGIDFCAPTVPEIGITLCHESAHAHDWLRGKLDKTDNIKYKGLEINEWRATSIENQVRAEMKFPLRTHYIIDEKGIGIPPRLLKEEKGYIICRYEFEKYDKTIKLKRII